MIDAVSLDDPRIASYIARAEVALGYPRHHKQAANNAFEIWAGPELRRRIGALGPSLVSRCQLYGRKDVWGYCSVVEDTYIRRAVRGLCCYPDDAHMIDMHPDALRLVALHGSEPALAFLQFVFLLAHCGENDVS